MPRRLLFLLAVLAACLVLVPAAAQARTAVRVGIGDQSAAMFDNSAFQRAKLKRVRYFRDRIELIPENRAYQPLVVRKDLGQTVQIVGPLSFVYRVVE